MSRKRMKLKIISFCLLLNFALFSVFSPILALAEQNTSVDVPVLEKLNEVDRLSGVDRYETAAKIAQRGWKSSSEYAVLAAGADKNLTDALVAAPLAKLKNAPLFLTEGDNLNPYTEAELKRLDVKTVYIVSGEAILSKAVKNRLTEMGINVVSLAGKDRFETSVNIARELGEPTKIVITTSANNVDALSIAPIAAAQGIPILFSNADKLPDSVATYLEGIKGNVVKSYVIGGQKVLSDNIKNALPNSIRVSGINRYETNIEVLKTFANSLNYRNTYIANGENGHLVDALAGAPLAAITSSPMLLVSSPMTDPTNEFAKLYLSPTMIALGGQSALSEDSIKQLTSALTDNLTITEDNVVVENVNVPYSILVQGDNATLKNVNVKGTVFIDPGEKGTTTLDNVTAGKIVVLSGATESIYLDNVFTEILQVVSSNIVRIATSGKTDISNILVCSDAILDVVEGSVGNVEITNVLDSESLTVELRGTYAQPILVSSSATVIAGPSSNIYSLKIEPENSKQIVALEGNFDKVEINAIGIINLGSKALLNELITNVKASIDVENGARIINYNSKGNEGVITGAGADDLFNTVPASDDEVTSEDPTTGGDETTEDSNPSSISLNFTPADQLMDPTKPVMYLTDQTNKKVYAVNYETKQISSLTFDLTPERMAYENNELYVTLLKGDHEYWTESPLAGAIAIIDTATFTLADRFDIGTDPFDLVVQNGYIYVIPGSNQWEPISSYSRSTGLKIADSSEDIRFQSFVELNLVSGKIVSVDTDTSPRDMSLISISNGNVASIVDSPYHGDYPMATNFGISADGKYVVNGSGEVFDANLNHVTSLNRPFYDIAFNSTNNNFYTADKLNNTITAYAYDPLNTFKAIATYHTAGPVNHLFYQNDRLIAVSGTSVDVLELSPDFTSVNIQEVTINGPSSVTIPAEGSSTASEFTATVKDEFGNTINNYFVNWSLQSTVTGVSLSTKNGASTLVNVNNSTTGSAITLSASADNVNTTKVIQLTELNPQVTISGPSQLTVPGGVNKTSANILATVKDQFGTTLKDYPVNWSLQSPVEGVSLSTTTGSAIVLSIDSTATASEITVVASVGSVNTTQVIQLSHLISLGFTPTDQLMDPTKPVIYLTDKANRKVYAVNYETKELSSLTFDLPPERLAYENNELYVTLLESGHQYSTQAPLTGAVAIIDTVTFTLTDRFNIDTDPFDMVVRNGYIYVIPGSNQWEPISSYLRSTGLKVADSIKDIRFQSFAELNPVSGTIVSVTTDTSPRDMSIINISNGNVDSIVDSPYHGDYPMATNFGISADGQYVFNGSGEVFYANNLNHVMKLKDAFYDIAFNPDNNNFYTADKLNNTITEYAYDTENTFKPIATYPTNSPVSRLFYQNNRLIIISGNTMTQIPLSL